MSFLAPIAAVFGITIPVVVLLYLLKLKRKEILVSSTFLWRRTIEDLRANAPFQKLRRNLLLLLQLIVLVLLVLALMRPFVQGRRLEGQVLILVIDNSASMAATDVDPNRLGEAKRAALTVVNNMNAGDTAMVLSFSNKAQLRESFISNKEALRKAIREIEIEHTGTDLRDALIIAHSLSESHRQAEALVFSDGAFPPIEELGLSLRDVRFVPIGGAPRNLSITAFDVRESPLEPGEFQVFTKVENFGTQKADGFLDLYLGEELLDAAEVQIEPGEPLVKVFEGLPATRGVLSAKLDVTDHLALDDQAWHVLEQTEEIDVLLVSEGNYFLEKVLNIDPMVILSQVAPENYVPTDEYAVTVFDGFSPPDLSAGNHLFINAVPPVEGCEAGEEIDQPAIIDWDRQHPLMRFANLSNLNVVKARIASLPSYAEVVAESRETALIAAIERGPIRLAYVGFDIGNSDWPLRASFPIFFSNVIAWLRPESAAGKTLKLETGDAVPILPDKDVENAVIIDPDGNEHDVVVDPTETVFFSNTKHVGIYTLSKEAKPDAHFAVNLLSAAESNIAPRDHLTLGRREVAGAPELVSSNREFWRYLAAVALAVLLLEWYIYSKRAWM